MTAYTINYTHTGATIDCITEDSAIAVLSEQYGDEIVTGDWEPIELDREDKDEGIKSRARMLVWADDETADNDDSGNAVAEIIKTVA